MSTHHHRHNPLPSPQVEATAAAAAAVELLAPMFDNVSHFLSHCHHDVHKHTLCTECSSVMILFFKILFFLYCVETRCPDNAQACSIYAHCLPAGLFVRYILSSLLIFCWPFSTGGGLNQNEQEIERARITIEKKYYYLLVEERRWRRLNIRRILKDTREGYFSPTTVIDHYCLDQEKSEYLETCLQNEKKEINWNLSWRKSVRYLQQQQDWLELKKKKK